MNDEASSLAVAPSGVPDSSHYSRRYLLDGRIFSFAHQIDTTLRFEPNRVLEIGVGPGLVAAALRAAGVQVVTADVESSLCPDVLGSVTSLPLDADSFDVSICCQVLEHLPFEDFDAAMRELRRISRFAVLSLPDASPHRGVVMRLHPLFSLEWWTHWQRRAPTTIPATRMQSSGHHWEIGYSGYPLPRIEKAIRLAGWRIDKSWRVPEKPWHRFFKLRRN